MNGCGQNTEAALEAQRSSNVDAGEVMPPVWFQEFLEADRIWKQSFTEQLEKTVKVLNRIIERQVRSEAKYLGKIE